MTADDPLGEIREQIKLLEEKVHDICRVLSGMDAFLEDLKERAFAMERLHGLRDGEPGLAYHPKKEDPPLGCS